MEKLKIKRADYPIQYEKVVFGLGLIPQEGVPQIKITYRRTRKEFFVKNTNSKDVADFIRRTFKAGTLELQESFITLYFKHSEGNSWILQSDIS